MGVAKKKKEGRMEVEKRQAGCVCVRLYVGNRVEERRKGERTKASIEMFGDGVYHARHTTKNVRMDDGKEGENKKGPAEVMGVFMYMCGRKKMRMKEAKVR